MHLCPKCELNYIKEDEELCQICKPLNASNVKRHNKDIYNTNKT